MKVIIFALYQSHVQATHATCQQPGMRPPYDVQQIDFIFSRDNPLSNPSNLLPTGTELPTAEAIDF
jgi:hypothetical protein